MRKEIISLFGGSLLLGAKIQLFLDENIDQDIVDPLRLYGITVVTTEEAGMKGERNDVLQLAKATELGCVLLTHDRDFIEINEAVNDLWLIEGTTHAGIIYIERGRTIDRIVSELKRIHDEWSPEQMANLFWVI